MSRSEKRRKREQREQFRSQAITQQVHARRTSNAIDVARSQIEQRDWRNARATLEECERLEPGRTEVLRLLLDVYHEQRDYAGYCRICPRLIEKDPHNRPLHLMLATAYQEAFRPATSLAALRRYVARWPDDPTAGLAREMIGSLAPVVDAMLCGTPFPAAEKLELAGLHEEVLASVAIGDFKRTILIGEQLLARCPIYVPVMNNLAIAYYECGRTDDALAMSQRVLDRDVDNCHALANITRHLLLSGRHSDADRYCAQLRDVHSDRVDIWFKKAETFSYFGDDQAVLDALEGALQSHAVFDRRPDVALLYHLAAVAHARQGRLDAARRHWRESLEIQPGFELAKENLADLQRPVALREGPWPYSLNYWIRLDVLDDIQAEITNAKTGQDERPSDAQIFARIAARRPEFISLIPLFLDRGDHLLRDVACRFARGLDTPELREALRVFCLSQRGPDQMRINLATELMQKNVLQGPLRLWLEGEWQDVELLGYELSDEAPDPGYSDPQTAARFEKSAAALARRDPFTARGLLEQCLAAEGDRPELLYNLAVSYQQEGRNEEGHEIFRRIHRDWPDYFLGTTTMAFLAAQEGDFARANELLDDLRRRRRMRHIEFSALCATSIQVDVAQRKFDGARGWLAIWKKSQPDHPQIAAVERRLQAAAAR